MQRGKRENIPEMKSDFSWYSGMRGRNPGRETFLLESLNAAGDSKKR
jgi:hypothetical protein